MSNRFTNLHSFLLLLAIGTFAAGCAQEVPLPPSVGNGSDVFLKVDTRVIEDVVPRRATLAGLLDTHEFDGSFVYQFVEAVRPVFDPRRIRVATRTNSSLGTTAPYAASSITSTTTNS